MNNLDPKIIIKTRDESYTDVFRIAEVARVTLTKDGELHIYRSGVAQPDKFSGFDPSDFSKVATFVVSFASDRGSINSLQLVVNG
ncbi:MAG: hypothetical protein ACRC92_27295 [Peptostreptococcaceae bacterium]